MKNAANVTPIIHNGHGVTKRIHMINTRALNVFALSIVVAGCSGQKTPPSNGGQVIAEELGIPRNIILFGFDRSNLNPDARATLDQQATSIANNPMIRIQVTGNCDERGTEEYNLALGQRRADTAALYLEAKGIAANRIKSISYGKERPIAAGSGEQAWAQNRNAIFVPEWGR